MIAMIAAMARGRVIGKDNAMPWHLSEDLKWFKQNTLGKPIVMGRRTYESIGRPLPGRRNVVLSRQADLIIPGCDIVHSVDEVLELDRGYSAQDAEAETMIIGGGNLYNAFLPYAQTLYLTEIELEVEGDTWFPAIDLAQWRETLTEHHSSSTADGLSYTFKILRR